MLLDVISAEYVGDFKIKVTFEDGKTGVIDLSSSTKEGVFTELADIKYFKKFYVNKDIGTICWPNGQDIAPEKLYKEIH